MDSRDPQLLKDVGHLAKLGIDVARLEREMNAAVAKDTRYWLENDTKIRAVEQGVPTYEHFRQLVAGCHLRPMDRSEFSALRKTPSVWSPIGTSAPSSAPCPLSTSVSYEKETMTPQKFYSKLQLLCKHNDVSETERKQRLVDLLFSQQPSIFRELFDTGLGASILPIIIATLDYASRLSMAEPESTEFGPYMAAIKSILRHSRESKQFSLAVDLLSEQEVQSAHDLFERVQYHESSLS